MLSGEHSQNNNLNGQELKKKFLYSCRSTQLVKVCSTLSTSFQGIHTGGFSPFNKYFGLNLVQFICWISFPFRLPQLLCIHISQFLKIRVRNRHPLIDGFLQSMFGCQVNNSVSPDTNMPWNPSKNNVFLTYSTRSTSPLKEDDHIWGLQLILKQTQNQTTLERTFLDWQMRLRARWTACSSAVWIEQLSGSLHNQGLWKLPTAAAAAFFFTAFRTISKNLTVIWKRRRQLKKKFTVYCSGLVSDFFFYLDRISWQVQE